MLHVMIFYLAMVEIDWETLKNVPYLWYNIYMAVTWNDIYKHKEDTSVQD
jgi:hypothetical protein